MYHMFACLPEESVRNPGNEVKGGYALWVVGNEPRSPARTACALYLWAISPALFHWWFESGWTDTALSPAYDLTYDSIFQGALLYFQDSVLPVTSFLDV